VEPRPRTKEAILTLQSLLPCKYSGHDPSVSKESLGVAT
jgi:hypothetical protein